MKRFQSVLVGLAGIGLLTAAAASAEVQVLKKIPYAAQTGASNAVKEECKLDTLVPEALAAASSDVKLVGKLGGGKQLEVVIRDVHAPGGGIFSGPKWVTLKGTLKQGGKELGSFTAKRNSLSGSGTCGMLGRSVTAIADDIAEWLKNPSSGANLGDAR